MEPFVLYTVVFIVPYFLSYFHIAKENNQSSASDERLKKGALLLIVFLQDINNPPHSIR